MNILEMFDSLTHFIFLEMAHKVPGNVFRRGFNLWNAFLYLVFSKMPYPQLMSGLHLGERLSLTDRNKSQPSPIAQGGMKRLFYTGVHLVQIRFQGR